jgi:hypothetical protein
MLTSAQRSEFESSGILRLTGVFGARAAAQMTNLIWSMLERQHGIRRGDAQTWSVAQPTGFQSLTRVGAFDAIASEALREDIDQVLDLWEPPKHWGAPLVTFPDANDAWDVPSAQWHLDFPARGSTSVLAGVRVLAFIDDVAERSGGTLALTGSHQLVGKLMAEGRARSGRSAEVRDALAGAYGWLQKLWSAQEAGNRVQAFMIDGATLDGVLLKVVELTGVPGDVVLMHPRLFHAPSRNVGAKPRMMVSQSVFRRG